jgi:hypothetical protein
VSVLSFMPGGHRSAPKTAMSANETAVIGPASAGKSFLGYAFFQAASLNQPGLERFTLTPRNAETARAVERASRFMLGGAPAPPSGWKIDKYQAFAELKRGPATIQSSLFTLHDVPGGLLFPVDGDNTSEEADWTLSQVAEASASSLVVCVDSAQPHLELLYRWLPTLLQKAQDQSSHQLKLRQVLLLLTKIDEPVSACHEAARRQIQSDRDRYGNRLENAARVYLADISHPRDLADRLNPIANVKKVVGQELLARVLSLLGPNQRLAAGVCSAFGFDASGDQTFNQTTGEHLLLEGEPKEARLKTWSPFGVRDVLRFLLTGIAEGMVSQVDWEDCAHYSEPVYRIPF